MPPLIPPVPSPPADPALDRLCGCFEQLTPATLPELADCYAADASFRDPFNQVQGRSAIMAIFAHMFATLHSPHFCILQRIGHSREAGGVMLIWDFHYQRTASSAAQTIHGSSHLRFDPAGLVTYHRDYWDTSEELYQHLPVLGAVLRWLQRKLSTPETQLAIK
jgi:hypothetical protein